MTTYRKDPDDRLDYSVDWSEWLEGDTIASSTWHVDSGLTVVSDAFSTTVTTVLVSGGTANTEYKLVNRITTAGGLVKETSFKIRVIPV